MLNLRELSTSSSIINQPCINKFNNKSGKSSGGDLRSDQKQNDGSKYGNTSGSDERI